MLRRALASARHVLSHPRPLIPICLVFAVSNALTSWPRARVSDAPWLGLIYVIVMVIRTWSALGVQNVALALALADRAYVLEEGVIVACDTPDALRQQPHIRRAYLGLTAEG